MRAKRRAAAASWRRALDWAAVSAGAGAAQAASGRQHLGGVLGRGQLLGREERGDLFAL